MTNRTVRIFYLNRSTPTVNRCGCNILDINHWFAHDRYEGVDLPSTDFFTFLHQDRKQSIFGTLRAGLDSAASHQSMAKTTSNWALVSQTGHRRHYVWTKWWPWRGKRLACNSSNRLKLLHGGWMQSDPRPFEVNGKKWDLFHKIIIFFVRLGSRWLVHLLTMYFAVELIDLEL